MKTETATKRTNTKLERYATMTAAFMATAGMVQAGIVYTDLDPDETAINSNILIDMDQDGTWDFRAEQSGYGTGNSTFFFTNQITRLRGNMASGPAYGWVNNGFTFQAAALSSGQTIGPASPITVNNWATCGAYKIFSSAFSFSSSIRGDWVGAENKYFGVEFSIGGNTHYGWIRASVAGNCAEFTVRDWAYEDVPGMPIAAGDIGGCNAAIPPQNPVSTNGASGITLSWDAVSGSVGCQVQGTRTSPPGASGSTIVSGSPATSFTVPYTILTSGDTWVWSVRCACSTSPLVATPISASNSFTVPSPRKASDLLNADLYPNPASETARLDLKQSLPHDTRIVITNAIGQEVDFIMLPANAANIDLDLAALEPGLYFVQVGDRQALPIEVTQN